MAYRPYTLEIKKKFGIVLSSPYGMRGDPPKMHIGADYAPTIDRNSKKIPIIASWDGKVQLGKDGFGALWIQLFATDGRRYFNLHLDRYAVANNSEVKAGQLIGYMGTTGHSTGIHLHFETRLANGTRVNPENQGLVYFGQSNDMTNLSFKVIGKVTADKLNIRKLPDTKSEVIGTLAKDTEVVLTTVITGESINENTLWYAYSDGYISDQYIEKIRFEWYGSYLKGNDPEAIKKFKEINPLAKQIVELSN